MSFSTFVPVAPFYGTAQTGGSVNSPGVIQLYNPASSGVTVWVYETTIGIPSGLVATFRPPNLRMRRSTASMTRGGGFTEGIARVMRPDPSYTSASSVSFTCWNFTSGASIFQDNDAQWFGWPGVEGQNGWQPTYIRQGNNCFPVSLQPGTSLEFQPNEQGITNIVHTCLLWTEEAT